MPESSSARRAEMRACATEILDVVPGVMNAVRTSMRRNIGEGLSIPQFRCLGFIGREPDSSVSGVAAFLGVTLATASAMVERLVRAGYVQTVTSSTDRRRSELRVTPDGKALVDRVRGAARRDISETLGQASQAEINSMMQGLAALKGLFRRGGGHG